jgi:Protein of unknown function (DUF3093)
MASGESPELKPAAGPRARPATGSEPPATHYRERLWPGLLVWLGAAGAAATLGIAYGAALGAAVGWAVAAGVGATAGLLIERTSPGVVVRHDALAVGKATLPWWATGGVVVLDPEAVRRARGRDGDPTAYAVMRPGVGPGAVLIEVVDPDDPHGTWLVGSRNAEAMARAIGDARGRLTP